MKKWIFENKLALGIILLITILFTFPYFVLHIVPIEHDTFFHLSRIEQYSIALKHGDILPAISPFANANFGYASPLFYCDILLLPFALLHLCNVSLAITYRILIFVCVYFSGLNMYICMKYIQKNSLMAYIATIAYLFCNYHISDIYVRGALGESMAFIFLPMIILGIYQLFFEEDTKKWKTLCFGLLLLVLTHNLTFLFGVLLVILSFLYTKSFLKKEVFIATCKAASFAFLISAFYTLPMLEQLSSQRFLVHYYGANSDLGKHSMTFLQYFVNHTIFSISSNELPINDVMVVNIGYFLSFIPILYFFLPKDKHTSFYNFLCIIGYITFLLPSSLIPWDHLHMFSIIQFPWRLNTIACLLLSIVSAYALCTITTKKVWSYLCISFLLVEGVYHVLPVTSRTFGLHTNMTWQDVVDGRLVDPYYSANYMRVELAAADYLPINHPDFRNYPYEVYNIHKAFVPSTLNRDYSKLSISFEENQSGTFELPLTYYKGYQVYDNNHHKLPTYESNEGMVMCDLDNIKEVYCEYHNTPLRNISICVSLISLLVLIIYHKKF